MLCNCVPYQEPEEPHSKCREVHVWHDEEGNYHREIIEENCEE